jgi:DNA-binding NarL/FixJ family response regulator
MSAIRVLVVDDEFLVRRVLTEILAPHKDVSVVAGAATGDEAISSVGKFQPDIVVMDIAMPKMDGVAAAREIKRQYPDVKIIGLSEHAPGYNVHAMETAGVVGVYLKSKATEELYTAIKKASGQDCSG